MSYRLSVAELRNVYTDLRRRIEEVTLSRFRRWSVRLLQLFALVQLLTLVAYKLLNVSLWDDAILVIAGVSILAIVLFLPLTWPLIRTMYRQRKLYRELELFEPDAWLSPEGRSSLPRWGSLLLGIAQVALLARVGWVLLYSEKTRVPFSGDNPALWLLALLLLVSSLQTLFGWELPARGLELLAVTLTVSLAIVWMLALVFLEYEWTEGLLIVLLVLPACLIWVVSQYLARTRRRFAPFRSAEGFSDGVKKLLDEAEAAGRTEIEVGRFTGIQLAGWENWLSRSERLEALHRSSKRPAPLSYAISARAGEQLAGLEAAERLAVMDHIGDLVADRSADPGIDRAAAEIEHSRVPETAWSLAFREERKPRHLEILELMPDGAEGP